jgi:CheY-like chemotaxis protein
LAETVQALGSEVRNLLVVDDDPAMVRFVTLALEDEALIDKGLTEGLKDEGLKNEGNGQYQGNGYQFTTALTGTEALEQLHQQPPDAVLLDLGLPDINGWEVLAQLRQEPELADLPVVIITANDFPQMLQTDQQEALQVLLNRPFSRQEISTILKGLLEALQPSYPTLSAPTEPGHPVTLFG